MAATHRQSRSRKGSLETVSYLEAKWFQPKWLREIDDDVDDGDDDDDDADVDDDDVDDDVEAVVLMVVVL